MGVHYFFPWIQKECSQCLRPQPDYEPGCVLLFDVNGLLYGAPRTPKEMCSHVMNIVKDRVSESKASVAVLAIDGVAPKAKRCQQRKRRALNPTNNMLSVGTEFMHRLESEFVDYLDNYYVCPTVYFSGPSVPGEGEHKLFKFLNRFDWKEQAKYIFGVDGDLIMLSLLSKETNVHIVRPVFMRPGKVECINVNLLKEYVELRFSNVASFVCAANVLGNDFLPSIEPHDTRDTFEDFLKTVQHLCLVDENKTINWTLFSSEPTECGKRFAVGMQWILDYYTQKNGSETVDWVYDFNDRPRWEEIGHVEPVEFINTDPFERCALFQLFFLLPVASISLLPLPLQIVYAETFSVETKKRKKRPSWDVDYKVDNNQSINLLNLYKLVHSTISDHACNRVGKTLRFQKM